MMEIKSTFLGTQHVDPDTVINFPNGIPGFENRQRYKLFHDDDGRLVYWMQSVDDPDLTFSVTHPTQFNIHYEFVLSDEEERLLEIDDPDQLLILILLSKNEEELADGQPRITGSIKAPLLINSSKCIGLQKILMNVEKHITLTEKSSEFEAPVNGT